MDTKELIKSAASRLTILGWVIEREGKSLKCGKCGKQVKRFNVGGPDLVMKVANPEPDEPSNMIQPMAEWDGKIDELEGLIMRITMAPNCSCWGGKGYQQFSLFTISDLQECQTKEQVTTICGVRLRTSFLQCRGAFSKVSQKGVRNHEGTGRTTEGACSLSKRGGAKHQ